MAHFALAERKKRSQRMKRLSADPKFAAKRDAAALAQMKRLNADPKFRSANRARMKRQRADPVFAAKRLAACSTPPKVRAAIIAALKADPHAKRVTAKIGGPRYKTVRKIAKEAGIKLIRGNRD
jgi:hypothetical protein